MALTIKVTGLSEEMVRFLDDQVKERHMNSRAELVRALLRDAMSTAEEPIARNVSHQKRLDQWLEQMPLVGGSPSTTWRREEIYE